VFVVVFCLSLAPTDPETCGSVKLSPRKSAVLSLSSGIVIDEPALTMIFAVVVTPEILTLSNSVWPSTSKLPFASIAPVNVEMPATFRLSVISTPVSVVARRFTLS